MWDEIRLDSAEWTERWSSVLCLTLAEHLRGKSETQCKLKNILYDWLCHSSILGLALCSKNFGTWMHQFLGSACVDLINLNSLDYNKQVLALKQKMDTVLYYRCP